MTNFSATGESNRIQNDLSLTTIDHHFRTSWLQHAPFTKDLLRHFEPNRVVELGVHYGFSLCLIAQEMKELSLDAPVIGVDNWQGDSHTGNYDASVYGNLASVVNTNFSNVKLLEKYFDDALADFDNESIDLLHIDGSHIYEDVSNDFWKWLPKVSKRGIIMLHDTSVKRDNFGVWQLWEEIETNFPGKVCNFNFGNGLGIIAPNELQNDWLKFLFEEYVSDNWTILEGAYNDRATKIVDFYVYGFFSLKDENSNLDVVLQEMTQKMNSILEKVTKNEISQTTS